MSEYIAFKEKDVEKLEVSPTGNLNHEFIDANGKVQHRRLQPILIDGKTYLYAYEGDKSPLEYKIKSEISRLKPLPYK